MKYFVVDCVSMGNEDLFWAVFDDVYYNCYGTFKNKNDANKFCNECNNSHERIKGYAEGN